MSDSRGYKIIIREAELLAMPPDAVATFLKSRSEQPDDVNLADSIDSETEEALRCRKDPLIDISLARYGRYSSTLSKLFHSATENSAIRLACLSNKVGNPKGYIPYDTVGMVNWISNCADEELNALFENPFLCDHFLLEVFEQKKGWENFENSRFLRIVSILARNPRMHSLREEAADDGYEEFMYRAIFDAAWKLAESVPVSKDWAETLGNLYARLPEVSWSIKSPLTTADRWHADVLNAESIKDEDDSASRHLSENMQRVRTGLAKLALRNDPKLQPQLLNHPDNAFRCAVYSIGTLDATQVHSAFERDGEQALFMAIHNQRLWRRASTRECLLNFSRAIAKEDKNSDNVQVKVYRWIEKEMRQKNPSWFDDEDACEIVVESQLPATKADLAEVLESMNAQNNSLRNTMQTVVSRTGWIWWIALGALAANLWHA